MKKTTLVLFLLILLTSCKSTYKDIYHYHYKYLNDNRNFKEHQGDFFNVKFQESSDYNVLASFHSKFQEYKNILRVMVRTTKTSKESILNKNVTVISSKHGLIKVVSYENVKTYRNYPPIIFIKKFKVKSKNEVTNIIENDTITISIENQKYRLVSPI